MKTKSAKALDKTGFSSYLSGAVVEKYRKCGKPNCRCANGTLHGPYHYRTWREAGKQQWQYIPRSEVQAVMQACETNRRVQKRLRQERGRMQEVLQRSRDLLREVEQQLCRKR